MTLSPAGWQERFTAIHNNRLFETAVISIIILSAMVIGANTYDIGPRWQALLTTLDVAVTVFFLFEILLRMAVEKNLRDFFRQGWNIFDFLIVTVSLIPLDETDMVLLARLLRIFRVLRLISFIPELRILMNALFKAIPRMGYVALLMFIIFYIYGAVGSFMFEGINKILWGDISISMLTLFRVATFEDWTDVMYETMAVYPLSWTFYLSFIFLTAFVFLNMMIGVVLDVMQTEHEKHNREHGEGEAGEVHWLRQNAVENNARLERIERLLAEIAGRNGKGVPVDGAQQPIEYHPTDGTMPPPARENA